MQRINMVNVLMIMVIELLENQANVNATDNDGKRADDYDDCNTESKRLIREYHKQVVVYHYFKVHCKYRLF